MPIARAVRHVGVADEGHVLHVLDAHHAEQSRRSLRSPRTPRRLDLVLKLLGGHLRFLPAVWRNDPAIRLRGVIDDGIHRLEVALPALPDHGFTPCSVAPLVFVSRITTVSATKSPSRCHLEVPASEIAATR